MMNLIDRYVNEVGKRLPRKNRLDIEAEIRSTLEDIFEDRKQQAKGQSDEALIEEILSDYGSPKRVAATYQTHKYLIGPEIFPIYTLVLKIVLAAITLGLVIANAFSMIGPTPTVPEIFTSLVGFAGSLVGSLIAAFGNLTLIFAILDRVIPASEFDEEQTWTPADLTREPDPGQVSRGEMIAGIVFTVAGLILLNFYPQIIAVWNFENGEWVKLLTLSEGFFRYLPWINLSGILNIALSLFVLRQGTWKTISRWVHIGLQLFGVGIVVALLRSPGLIEISPLVADLEAGMILTKIFNIIIPVALLITIIINCIEIVKDVYGLLRPGKAGYPAKSNS